MSNNGTSMTPNSKVWTIDKLVFEFKHLHANKYSTQSSARLNQGNQSTSDISGPVRKQPVTSNSTTAFGRNTSKGRSISPYATQSQNNLNPNSTNTTSQRNLKRYELLYYKQHQADAKIEKFKDIMLTKELEECTFKPQITNMGDQSRQFNRSGNRTPPPGAASGSNYRSYAYKTNELNNSQYGSQSKLTSEQMREKRDLQECTFKPQVNSTYKGVTDKRRKEHTPTTTAKIRGYQEQVERIRKTKEMRDQQQIEYEKEAIGEKYDRVKLANMRPPSFIDDSSSRSATIKKQSKKLIMYVDVNINPQKTGRIGIYEGDNLKELAKNFCRTFQLNQRMFQVLVSHLEQSLAQFQEQQDQKYILPSAEMLPNTTANDADYTNNNNDNDFNSMLSGMDGSNISNIQYNGRYNNQIPSSSSQQSQQHSVIAPSDSCSTPKDLQQQFNNNVNQFMHSDEIKQT